MNSYALPQLKASWSVAPAAVLLIGAVSLIVAPHIAAATASAVVTAIGITLGAVAIGYAACVLASVMLASLRGTDHLAGHPAAK
ncbi:hypothetical protein [Bifidobacterium thermophilum]|uniref:hypothetical protein n=1 Tax=Bifidobacterium thermophilum TaxID=33905 RepID=UPI0030964341